jgi:hypothetical protein
MAFLALTVVLNLGGALVAGEPIPHSLIVFLVLIVLTAVVLAAGGLRTRRWQRRLTSFG